MSMNAGIPAKAIRPKCADCGKVAGLAVPLPYATEAHRQGIIPGGYVWLCGDCAYLRERPDAPRTATRTRGKPADQLSLDDA